MTTNKPECLDDALVRKGRVDIQLHIDYPNKEQVERFYQTLRNNDCFRYISKQ